MKYPNLKPALTKGFGMKQYFSKVLVNRYELPKFMQRNRRLKFNSISLICCALKCLGDSCLKQQGGYRKGVHLKSLCLDMAGNFLLESREAW